MRYRSALLFTKTLEYAEKDLKGNVGHGMGWGVRKTTEERRELMPLWEGRKGQQVLNQDSLEDSRFFCADLAAL